MNIDARLGSFAELESARSLVPAIHAAQPHIHENRELPAELVRELTGKGMFRLLLPTSLGGSQLTLLQFMRCVEVIAHADGSAGWCVGQGGVFPNVSDYMHPATAEEIWVANPDAVVATGTPFGSKARAMPDGYSMSGRWRFASGCTHASWLAAMATIVHDADNDIGFGMFLVPRAEINLLDGWNVRGLRGCRLNSCSPAHSVQLDWALRGVRSTG